MARITLSNLAHSYLARPTGEDDYALKTMDHVWEDGGAYALLGSSGCGKSTLLNCIAGLLEPTDGQIWIKGRNVTWEEPSNRGIGMVFQSYALYPQMTVEGNLSFGLRNARVPKDEIARRVARAAEVLQIQPLLRRKPAALSGGQRQRVAIGRALLSAPRLLLMDEPLSALDEASRADILATFERLHDALPIPAIYVSHDLAEVARLADRMVVLSAGRVIAEGAVGPILERLDLEPATGRFEAGVLLTATVTSHDAGYRLTRLDLAGQPVSIPRVEVPVGDRVRLRIRARDVALATRPPEGISIRNRLSGRIVEIAASEEAPYAETLVEIADGVRLRSRVTRESVDDLGLSPGAPVVALVKTISFDGR